MSTTVDVERIESLEAQVRELENALNGARRIRLVFMCAVLALMALIIYLFLGMFRKVTSESFKLAVTQQVQERFEKNQVRYMNEVKTLVDNASPIVTEAFYAQSKADMPQYASAFEKERAIFLTEVQTKLDAQLRKKYTDLLAGYETRLVKEFPELQDEEFRKKVMRSLDKAIGELASKYYAKEMGGVIAHINESWDQFPQAELPKTGEPQLGDQLVGTLLELMSKRLAQ